MTRSTFRVGATVVLVGGSTASGAFEVVRRMPHEGGDVTYRLRSLVTGQERVVAEYELRPDPQQRPKRESVAEFAFRTPGRRKAENHAESQRIAATADAEAGTRRLLIERQREARLVRSVDTRQAGSNSAQSAAAREKKT